MVAMAGMAGQVVQVDPGYDTKKYRENAQKEGPVNKMAQVDASMKPAPMVTARREEVVIAKSPKGYDQPKMIEGAMVIKTEPKEEFQKKLASATSQADVLVKIQSIIADPKADPQVKELAVNFLSGARENAQKVVADPKADPQFKAAATDFLKSGAPAPAPAQAPAQALAPVPAPAPASDSSMWVIGLVLGILAFILVVLFLMMRRRGTRY